MVQPWIDQLLNWILPPIIFLALGYWLYKIFKKPLGGMGEALGLGWDKLKGNNEKEKQVNVTYE